MREGGGGERESVQNEEVQNEGTVSATESCGNDGDSRGGAGCTIGGCGMVAVAR
jgi:hypothetical protein